MKLISVERCPARGGAHCLLGSASEHLAGKFKHGVMDEGLSNHGTGITACAAAQEVSSRAGWSTIRPEPDKISPIWLAAKVNFVRRLEGHCIR
jgi:hypothetical protein